GRARLAASHALLVGDAAGVDPLMGEGISFALEYGLLAAEAIWRAHETRDWSFYSYVAAVERGPLGRKLRRLDLGSRLFYGPRGRWWFRLAAASRRAQRIGLAWLDGVADSKTLQAAVRERLAAEIRRRALAVGLGFVEPEEIDRLNIYRAGLAACRRAIEALRPVVPGYVLVDGREIPDLAMPQSA